MNVCVVFVESPKLICVYDVASGYIRNCKDSTINETKEIYAYVVS